MPVCYIAPYEILGIKIKPKRIQLLNTKALIPHTNFEQTLVVFEDDDFVVECDWKAFQELINSNIQNLDNETTLQLQSTYFKEVYNRLINESQTQKRLQLFKKEEETYTIIIDGLIPDPYKQEVDRNTEFQPHLQCIFKLLQIPQLDFCIYQKKLGKYANQIQLKTYQGKPLLGYKREKGQRLYIDEQLFIHYRF